MNDDLLDCVFALDQKTDALQQAIDLCVLSKSGKGSSFETSRFAVTECVAELREEARKQRRVLSLSNVGTDRLKLVADHLKEAAKFLNEVGEMTGNETFSLSETVVAGAAVNLLDSNPTAELMTNRVKLQGKKPAKAPSPATAELERIPKFRLKLKEANLVNLLEDYRPEQLPSTAREEVVTLDRQIHDARAMTERSTLQEAIRNMNKTGSAETAHDEAAARNRALWETRFLTAARMRRTSTTTSSPSGKPMQDEQEQPPYGPQALAALRSGRLMVTNPWRSDMHLALFHLGDFPLELERVTQDVLPFVEGLCQRLGLSFSWTDFTTAVSEQTFVHPNFLEECAEEVKRRSHRYPSTPSLLLLLGEKTHLPALPARIPAAEYRRLCKASDLIDQIYQVDNNAQPAEARLRDWEGLLPLAELQLTTEGATRGVGGSNATPNRSGSRPAAAASLRATAPTHMDKKERERHDSTAWRRAYIRVCRELMDAANCLPGPRAGEYRRLRMEKLLSASHLGRYVAMCRSFVAVDDFDPRIVQFFDLANALHVEEELHKAVGHPDRQIVYEKDNEQSNVARSLHLATRSEYAYAVEWARDGLSSEEHGPYINEFCNDLCSNLCDRAELLARQVAAIPPLCREAAFHAWLAEDLLRSYSVFPQHLSTLNAATQNGKGNGKCRLPFVIAGKAGYGKTTLLVQALQAIRQAQSMEEVENQEEQSQVMSGPVVLFRFAGRTGTSQTARALIYSLLQQLTEVFGEDAIEKQREALELEQKMTQMSTSGAARVEDDVFLTQLSDGDDVMEVAEDKAGTDGEIGSDKGEGVKNGNADLAELIEQWKVSDHLSKHRFRGTYASTTSLSSLDVRALPKMLPPHATPLQLLLEDLVVALHLASAEQPIYIYLDDLMRCPDADIATLLGFFRQPLPDFVHMFVTCDESPFFTMICGADGSERIPRDAPSLPHLVLEGLEERHSMEFLVHLLSERGRRMEYSQHDVVYEYLTDYVYPRSVHFLVALSVEACKWNHETLTHRMQLPDGQHRLLDIELEDIEKRISKPKLEEIFGLLQVAPWGLLQQDVWQLVGLNSLAPIDFATVWSRLTCGAIAWVVEVDGLEGSRWKLNNRGYLHPVLHERYDFSPQRTQHWHQRILSLWIKTPLVVKGGDKYPPVYHLRKMLEMPYHEIGAYRSSHEETKISDTNAFLSQSLGSLEFAVVMVKHEYLDILLDQYGYAVRTIPEAELHAHAGHVLEIMHFLLQHEHQLRGDHRLLLQLASQWHATSFVHMEAVRIAGEHGRVLVVRKQGNLPRDGLISEIRLNKAAIVGVYVSSDGQRVVCGSADGYLTWWSMQTASAVRFLKVCQQMVHFCVSPTTEDVVVISESKLLVFHANGLPCHVEDDAVTHPVAGLAISKDGARCVLMHADRMVTMDTSSWAGSTVCPGQPKLPLGQAFALCPHPADVPQAIVAGSDINLFNTRHGILERVLRPASQMFEYCCVDPLGEYVLYAWAGRSYFRRLPGGEPLRSTLLGDLAEVPVISPSGSGMLALIPPESYRVRLWDPVKEVLLGEKVVCDKKVALIGGSFSVDGSLLALGDTAGFVHIFNVPSLTPHSLVKGHETGLVACQFAETKFPPQLLTASEDGSVTIWNVAKKSGQYNLQCGSALEYAVISPNALFVAAFKGNKCRVFDKKGACKFSFPAYHSEASCIASFSPDSRMIALCGSEDCRTISIWNITSGQLQHGWISNVEEPLLMLSFLPTGDLVSADESHIIRLWNLPKKSSHTLVTRTSSVDQVQYTTDAKHVIVGSSAQPSCEVLNVRNGHKVAALELGTDTPRNAIAPLSCGGLRGMEPSKCGSLLATAWDDGFLRLYDTKFSSRNGESLLELGCFSHNIAPVTALSFNSPHLFVSGDGLGHVRCFHTEQALGYIAAYQAAEEGHKKYLQKGASVSAYFVRNFPQRALTISKEADQWWHVSLWTDGGYLVKEWTVRIAGPQTAFSPQISEDGKRMVLCHGQNLANSQELAMWSVETGDLMSLLPGSVDYQTPHALSGSAPVAAWWNATDHCLCLANMRTVEKTHQFKEPVRSQPFFLVVSSTGRWVLECRTTRQTLRLWLEGVRQTEVLPGQVCRHAAMTVDVHSPLIDCAAISHDEKILALACEGIAEVFIHSVATGNSLRKFAVQAVLASLHFAPKDDWIALSFSWDGHQTLRSQVVSSARGEVMETMPLHCHCPFTEVRWPTVTSPEETVQEVSFYVDRTRIIQPSKRDMLWFVEVSDNVLTFVNQEGRMVAQFVFASLVRNWDVSMVGKGTVIVTTAYGHVHVVSPSMVHVSALYKKKSLVKQG
jgi:WD40 repeat protein